MTMGIAILISGRGSNMSAVLRACQGALADRCEPLVVVSNRCRAVGLDVAAAAGVPTRCVPSRGYGKDAYGRALLDALEPFAPDLLVLAGFLRIVSPEVVRRYPGRIMNIHPADPARYRGAHGYAWAWEHRLEETQVTVHLVDEGMDTGPVLAMEPVDLRGATSLEEVEARGLRVEHRLFPKMVADVVEGRLDLDKVWRERAVGRDEEAS